MAARTVDLLLNLDTEGKPPAIRDLTKWFNELEQEAKQVRQELQKALDPKRAQELDARLKYINSDIKLIHGEAQKRTLEKSLKAASQQANQLRERMEKVQQVGSRIAFVGAAIVAPFTLAVKKYVDTVGEGEETSKRILELSERWKDSQVRIGRVTAEILLPTLEKALDVVDKITAFAEANPEFVKSAVGIGASLVVLGGIVSTTAQIVSTIATVKGLLAGVGLAGTASGTASGAGLVSAISAGISAAAPILTLVAITIAAAELTRRLVNWALGTDTTWRDIGVTMQQLLFISMEGWKLIPELLTDLFTETWSNYLEIGSKLWNMGLNRIRDFFNSLIQSIVNGFNTFGQYLSQGFSSLANMFSNSQSLGTGVRGYASGGYITHAGLFMGGEAGKEFVMNNATTKAAESMIGGNLNQASLLRSLSGGGSRHVSYYDARKFDSMPSSDARRLMKDEILKGLLGAF